MLLEIAEDTDIRIAKGSIARIITDRAGSAAPDRLLGGLGRGHLSSHATPVRRPPPPTGGGDRPGRGVPRGHRAPAGGARARPAGRRGGDPPGRGHRGQPRSRPRPSTGRSRSSATGSTRSASPSPRSRRRAATRSWSRCPGADNPEQVVNDLIQPAQLVFINFEANVVNQAGTPEAVAMRSRWPTAPRRRARARGTRRPSTR